MSNNKENPIVNILGTLGKLLLKVALNVLWLLSYLITTLFNALTQFLEKKI